MNAKGLVWWTGASRTPLQPSSADASHAKIADADVADIRGLTLVRSAGPGDIGVAPRSHHAIQTADLLLEALSLGPEFRLEIRDHLSQVGHLVRERASIPGE